MISYIDSTTLSKFSEFSAQSVVFLETSKCTMKNGLEAAQLMLLDAENLCNALWLTQMVK